MTCAALWQTALQRRGIPNSVYGHRSTAQEMYAPLGACQLYFALLGVVTDAPAFGILDALFAARDMQEVIAILGCAHIQHLQNLDQCSDSGAGGRTAFLTTLLFALLVISLWLICSE